MTPDHYATLGVSPDVSAADLRAAYLRLVKAYHPDGASGTSECEADAKMAAVNQAYSVIGDANRRRVYDLDRTIGSPGPFGASGPGSGARFGNAEWKPFDEDFHAGGLADVDQDPTPIVGSRQLPRWVAMAPVLLVAAAVLVAGLAIMINGVGVLALAAMIFLLGVGGFIAGPLIAMSRAERDPHL